MPFKLKYIVAILAVIIIAFPIINILPVNYVDGHDFTFHLVRVLTLEQQINQGNYFPRWLPEAMDGYGVPIFNFVWGFPYYLAVLLIKLGFSYPVMHKIWFSLPVLIAGFSAYLWAKIRSTPFIAAVAAITYVWTPFFFLGLFKRNTIGELYFLAFLPLVFYLIENAKKKYSIPFGALALATLIYSHNALALFAMGGLVLYMLFTYWQKKDLRLLQLQLMILGIGILLLAFFIIPALVYQYLLHNANITVSFPPWQSLIRSRWEGGSVFNGETLRVSYQIGFGHLMIIVSAVAILLIRYFLKKNQMVASFIYFKNISFNQLYFWLSIYLITIIFLLPVSSPLWLVLPLVKNIQFPYRLLFVLMFVTTTIIPFLLIPLKGKFQYLAGIGIVVLILFFNRNHLAVLENKGTVDDYRSYHSTLDGTGEFLPSYFNFDEYDQAKKAGLLPQNFELRGVGEITKSNRQLYQDTVTIRADSDTKLFIKRLYFPFWRLTIDSEPTTDFVKGNGILVNIPKGEHTVVYTYKEPMIIQISNWVSIITLIYITISLAVIKK